MGLYVPPNLYSWIYPALSRLGSGTPVPMPHPLGTSILILVSLTPVETFSAPSLI